MRRGGTRHAKQDLSCRSRANGIATGDQAIFVRRWAFQRVGGFPDQPLMEDIEFSRRMASGQPRRAFASRSPHRAAVGSVMASCARSR